MRIYTNCAKSHLEALFLIANYDYLNVASSHALNIHDFIFECAASLIPRSYWNNRFQNLAQDLGSSPALHGDSPGPFQGNLNLSQAAKALRLHRNTLLQRFTKIKSRTKLNPAGK
ncbi:MAG: helix-turn-helix domain-containing protein [Enterocloster bolteae]